jgi:hypothetical protein
MALPINLERPDRGRKPLVSVGIDGARRRALVFLLPPRAVPQSFDAMRFIKRWFPNHLISDLLVRREV